MAQKAGWHSCFSSIPLSCSRSQSPTDAEDGRAGCTQQYKGGHGRDEGRGKKTEEAGGRRMGEKEEGGVRKTLLLSVSLLANLPDTGTHPS